MCACERALSNEPCSMPECVLKDCVEQLAKVFTKIFNVVFFHARVPKFLKYATIVWVLQKKYLKQFQTTLMTVDKHSLP